MIDTTFNNEELIPDELPAYEHVHFYPISIRKRTKDLIANSLLVIALLGLGLYLQAKDAFEDWEDYLLIALPLLFFLLRYIDILIRQPYFGYALREKDILFRRGYVQQRTTVIPLNRVQHSAVHRSLLDRWLGIASLKIYTAGGSGSDLTIPGLTPEQALRLNEALALKVADYE